MTTAVLVSGQMRTLDVCFGGIYEHVLLKINKSGLSHSVYIEAHEDEDAHKANMLCPTKINIEPQPGMKDARYEARLGLGCYGVEVVLRQLWSLQKSWRLMEQSNLSPFIAGNWVIRLRPDCWFHNDIEDFADCDPACIYVPTFHNFYGLNDRFAFGGYEAMKVYCNRLDTMDEYIASGGIFHPESHLKWTLQRAGIEVKRTQILFDLVRRGGLHVKPQWNHDANYGDVLTC